MTLKIQASMMIFIQQRKGNYQMTVIQKLQQAVEVHQNIQSPQGKRAYEKQTAKRLQEGKLPRVGHDSKEYRLAVAAGFKGSYGSFLRQKKE